jgi:hypothetical protein
MMNQKIFPLNLPARAAYVVPGNPVVTRIEDGVGNCYPGLEYDHRNLDRRFFPGLIFDFISQDDRDQQNLPLRGARLTGIDLGDPALTPELVGPLQSLGQQFDAASATDLSRGAWYLHSIRQQDTLIVCEHMGGDDTPTPFDGLTLWRLIRSVEPGEVTLTLAFRGPSDEARNPVILSGRRRIYVESTGVIGLAYQPGELSQSLCSPWQHDFRDCGCTYWASNHPDIVLAEDRPGEDLLPSGESGDPARATTYIDWLRSDRRREATAAAQPGSIDRFFQMDHYEINQRWQELSIVLDRKEISSIYRAPLDIPAIPFSRPEELGQELHRLASLEHVLALEYLYSLYSLRSPNDPDMQDLRRRFPSLPDDLVFVRHELFAIAVSEMRHLRWVNEMLAVLHHERILIGEFDPELGLAQDIPTEPGNPPRRRELRPLYPRTLDDYIAVEKPSGGVDGQYARVLVTLKLSLYSEHLALYPTAARIIAEGMQHYSRFRQIRLVLQPYGQHELPYLRAMQRATREQAATALQLYKDILDLLFQGYDKGDAEESQFIAQARMKMFELDREAERLASQNLGVPFFD